eukprot:TRINITY_DN4634_c0_g1_i1.p2 TRINITY_DN4634_c0_g1~~TRINITY_DN4634_c0_g1_i1.p2  ORF type:complete len:235 (-),score=39.17 TRINITY_DN4634_c0_g1_i1:1136-1840(-)
MFKLFPDEYFHAGGDEVVTSCWLDDPEIVAWMHQHGYTSGTDVERYYEEQVLNGIILLQKHAVVWEDVFESLGSDFFDPEKVVVEVWRGKAELQKVVQAGFAGILAAGFYLDKQIPNVDQTFYEWVDTWRNFWENDPEDFSAVAADSDGEVVAGGQVLGGEGAMWAEQVDAVNFDSRVWPRACGIGERLWSPPETTYDIADATERLAAFRCSSLKQRFIGAGPVQPGYCPLPPP